MNIKKTLLIILIATLILTACGNIPNIDSGTTTNLDPTATPKLNSPEPLVPTVENVETGQVEGYVWHDTNHNGIQEGDEPGIGEVTVFVQGLDGRTIENIKTSAEGYYEINLPIGEYRMGFVSPDGFSLTLQNQGGDDLDSDPSQSDGLTEYFILYDDESQWDAGYILETSSFGPPDNPYPEPIGPNLEDFPLGYNPLTGLPVDDPNLLSMPAMLVSISNFPVTARPQVGLSYSPMVYEIYIGFGMTRFMTVFYGEFPEVETPVVGDCEINQEIIKDADFLLGNRVWLDENRNNIQDSNEGGLAGICISLIDFYTGKILSKTTTDSNGYYGFVVEGDGQYIVHSTLPEYFSFSDKDIGNNDYLDSDVYPSSGETNPIQMMSENDLSRDIGMFVNKIPSAPEAEPQAEEFGTIGDFVWLDLNENGIQDEGEPGVPGVEVTLYDWKISTYTTTTTSDAWGYYKFEGLADDQFYRIKVTPPPGYVFTSQYAGEDETKDSDVNQYGHSETLMINLNGGFETSWDAGLAPTIGVGPVRSGRIPYNYFNEFYPGSCLAYAGKTASLDIPICAEVKNNPEPFVDINNNYFGFDQLESIARNLWIPEYGINYSGNIFSYTPPDGGVPVSEFIMYYNALNQTKWMADPLSEGWLRFYDLADSTNIFYPSIDRLTGRRLIYNNVVVLFASHEVLNDEGTVIDISVSAGNFGRAWLFRDGQVYEIKWSTHHEEWENNTHHTRPIKFVDTNNNPFPLHPGNTWVHVVTQNTCLKESPYFDECIDPSDNPEQWLIKFINP